MTLDGVVAADRRVSVSLSSRQMWALTSARPRLESLTVCDDPDVPAPLEPAATDLNPEALLASAQLRDRVRAAIAALPADDRLLVRLRLEQDLTLAELARVCGFRDAQHADRRLRGIYRALRQQLE